MIVEFLNKNFNSVGDLAKVDKFIDDINLDKVKNQQNIEEKLRASNDRNGYHDELNVVNDMIQQVSQIINSYECPELHQGGEGSNKSYNGLDQIDSLISQYGNIDFLIKTKEALIERIELEKENSIFNSYNEVVTDINNLLEYHLRESIVFETDSINNHDEQDSVIHCYLNQLKRINEKINEFQEIEKDREEKIYFNNLIQRLSKIINQSEGTNNSIRSIFEKRLINSIKLIKINEITDINKISELNDSKELETLRLNFKDLIYLQSYDYLNKLNNYPSTLWSFDKLVEITFKFKFIYHFEDHNNKELNKFEIYLNFFKNYLNKNFKIFEIIFNNNFIFKDTDYEGEIFLYNLIKSMLIPLKEKLFNSINLIINNDKELSNFVIELTEFDKYLIENFGFNPNYSFNNNNSDQWSGLIGDLILFNTKIFNKWLNNEKLFVSHRYDEIVNNTNQNESELPSIKHIHNHNDEKNKKLILQPFKIDFDIVKDGETKPTNSSINLKNLIENITKTFENLSLKFQLKIISEVQLKLLDFYFEKLVNGLDALNFYKIEETSSNISNEDKKDTVKYLERVLRIYNSSEYMIENMKIWNEEIVFIELWNSISENNENCFFTSVINNYNTKINEKVFKILNNYFEKMVNNNFKFYYDMNQWTIDNINEINNNELNFAIKLIKSELNFLQKSINFKNYLNIKIRISKIILKFFNEKILKNFKINVTNSNKLRQDLNYIIKSIELPKLIEYKQFEQCITVLTDRDKNKDVTQLKAKYRLDLIDDKLIKEMVLRRG
ncbi:unnamed protein product [[Candida] boidinii]|uniref:Unnamed protein product n=1 Tax=Candida boidinii TaxID=5477 RepID=A0A9W6SVB9_CANBO|nr:unnamed protein product [[Candida] boidinii]